MKVSRNIARHRNPTLYRWLIANYDRLKNEIGSATDPHDLSLSRARWWWIETLPADYRGVRSTPLGLMMEWKRVCREMARRSADVSLRQAVRPVDSLPQSTE